MTLGIANLAERDSTARQKDYLNLLEIATQVKDYISILTLFFNLDYFSDHGYI